MTYEDFIRLMMDATEFETLDGYIAEVGGSVPENVPDGKIVPLLEDCYTFGRDQSIVNLRKMTGLSRAEFSRTYRIKLRSLENWETSASLSARSAPDYVVNLLAYAVVMDRLNS